MPPRTTVDQNGQVFASFNDSIPLQTPVPLSTTGDDKSDPWLTEREQYMVLAGGIAGLVLLIFVIVLCRVCCCSGRHRASLHDERTGHGGSVQKRIGSRVYDMDESSSVSSSRGETRVAISAWTGSAPFHQAASRPVSRSDSRPPSSLAPSDTRARSHVTNEMMEVSSLRQGSVRTGSDSARISQRTAETEEDVVVDDTSGDAITLCGHGLAMTKL